MLAYTHAQPDAPLVSLHRQYNFDATQEEQASRSSKAVAVIGTESGVPMKVATEVCLAQHTNLLLLW